MASKSGAQPLSLSDKLSGPGPKRILSIDGGGVRGILAAGVLGEIERRLQRRSGREDFRLCDYFDLIGGTSTGSIIAAALALGRSVSDVTALYHELAPSVFGEALSFGVRRPRFDAVKLEAALQRELGDHELGSPALKCGFAVFAKRIDTGSAWSLTNNPNSAYWEGGDGGFPNKRFKLRALVQASAAAPTFFEDREIRLIPEHEPVPPNADATAEFVDGGVAGLNDPSLQLLKIATLKPFGFHWPTGEDQMLMISVGTGYWRPARKIDTLWEKIGDFLAPEAASAVFALESMIHDSALNTLTTMQALSRPPKPWRINGELGDMANARLAPLPLLRFQRFDARMDDAAAIGKLGLNYSPADLEAMRNMANSDSASLAGLHEIGRSAAEDYFRRHGPEEPDWESEIFPDAFDPAWFTGPPAGPPRSRLEAMGRIFGGGKKK